jgi:hypothetical protein
LPVGCISPEQSTPTMRHRRAEVDALFAIDAAGNERRDGGRFDDLLAKAIVHYLMSAAVAGVPSREIALAPENPLVTWASATDPGTDLRSWLESRLGEMKPSSTAEPQLRLLLLRTF